MTKRASRIDGRIDAWEDPRDVFRVWLPAGRRVTFRLSGTADGDLSLHRTNVQTVAGRFASTGRLAQATARGRAERLAYVNRGAGRWAYLTVLLPARTLDATYRLTASSAA